MDKICNFIIKRGISTTTARFGKRNFRKFPLYNKRGSKIFKERQGTNPDPEVPVHTYGAKLPGYLDQNGNLVTIPEMIPQIIVPDLADCKFKPYVSYRSPDVVQSEFTSEDLFNVVYAHKIAKDFKEGKLNEDGSSKEPSAEEKQTSEEARLKARQTGSDIFSSR